MKKRPIIYKEDYALVPLPQGKFATIDVEDGPEIGKYNWHLIRNKDQIYVVRNARKEGSRIKFYLHRQIMQPEIGKEVDHINFDGLDNRSANLRVCSRQQNLQNRRKKRGKWSSSFKGVTWNKLAKKWCAYIYQNSTYICLGVFDLERHAAKAYDRSAVQLFGPFAYLNFRNG